MRRDRNKALFSVIATLVSVVLAIIYWLAPVGPDSHRLHILLIDCIPDSIVVLIAIPIVYWLFYRRGLSNMGDCPLFVKIGEVGEKTQQPESVQLSPNKTLRKCASASPSDVLVIVDLPDDLCGISSCDQAGNRLVESLNDTLMLVESKSIPVVFTAHGSSEGMCAIDQTRSCKMKPNYLKLPAEVYIPSGSVLYQCPRDADDDTGDPLDNPALDLLISNPNVNTVYVGGVFLEHCVQATCRSLLNRKKKVVAIESIIATQANKDELSSLWDELAGCGLIRQESLLEGSTK